jgi:hypothetical protein
MYLIRSCYFGELVWIFIIPTTEVIQVLVGRQNDNFV